MMDDTDLTLTFMCLPPSNSNEWLNLEHFVNVFNSIHDTSYKIESFPEHNDRSSPQPEILLRDGGRAMVIERKLLVWPPKFVKYFQLWHELSQRFFAEIGNEFTDGTYAFEITFTNLPRHKRAIIKLAADVTNGIRENQALIQSTGGIVCVDEPVEWKFYRLTESEREECFDGPIVRLIHPFEYYDEEQFRKSRPAISSAVRKLMIDASPKFDRFGDCLTILIIEPYTNVLNLTPRKLRKIIEAIEVPHNINQVWLAFQIELKDLSLQTEYQRIIG